MPAGVGADLDHIALAASDVAWVAIFIMETYPHEPSGPCGDPEPSGPAPASLGKVLALGESYAPHLLVGWET